MKLNKMISLVLSLGIILSTFAGIVTVNAAEVSSSPFTNLVENGDMEDITNNNWVASKNSSGSVVKIVEDSSDPSNHVVQFDGSENTGTMSYLYYSVAIAKNHKYYISYKIRLVECKDANVTKCYAYNGNNGTYSTDTQPLKRPEISTEWTTRSQIVTTGNSDATSFNLKILYDPASMNNNVKKVIFEVDDVVVYDFANAKELILPENTTIVSGAEAIEMTDADTLEQVTKYYSKAGEEVKLQYTGDMALSIEGVNVTSDGDVYTFTMPDADTTVTLVERPKQAFENLVENGDMEDVENIKWVALDEVDLVGISIVEDTTDSTNHVLQYDGSNVTNDSSRSFMSYNNLLTKGNTYYYSYKIRLVKCENKDISKFYAYNSNHTGNHNLHRPEIVSDWITRSGVFTPQSSTSFNFKIISDQGSSSSNVAKVIYEIDDVVVYDFTNIYEIELPKNTNLVEGGKRLDVTNNATELKQVPHYYAKSGDEVKLEYTGKEALSFEGATATLDGNTYTFTMPEEKVTVTEVKNVTFDASAPTVTVVRPTSFSLVVAEYNNEGKLASVLKTDYTTETANQTIELRNIEKFSEIDNWTGKYVFVWNSLTNARPLCKSFICE